MPGFTCWGGPRHRWPAKTAVANQLASGTVEKSILASNESNGNTDRYNCGKIAAFEPWQQKSGRLGEMCSEG
eukprot:1140785-Pelagomonas_calceolata.AAC.2